MVHKDRLAFVVRVLLVAGGVCGPVCGALAQAPVRTASAAAESDTPLAPTESAVSEAPDLEEIVVTARKRSERLIDVPAAITAIDAKTIERYAASDFNAIGNHIPQVMFTRNPSGNGGNINIRGIGTNTSADDGVEQSVSVDIDDVPTARGRILFTGLFDLEAVQVLKGPQALYFGKNSPGGVIVVQSKGPTKEMEGYARAGYESTAREYRAEAAISGPLNDTLGFRLAITGSDMSGGYVENVATPISAANNPIAFDRAKGFDIPGKAFSWGPQSKQVAGRVTLRWLPTERFDTTLKFMGSYYQDNGDASQNVIASCVPGAAHASTTDLSGILFTGRPAVATDPNSDCRGNRRQNDIGELPAPLLAGLPFNKNSSEFTHNISYLSSLVMNYHLPSLVLTSVTGYYKYSNLGTSFFDDNEVSLAGGAANSFDTSWSEELRTVTTFNAPVNVTAGVFYGHDSHKYRTFSDIVRFIDPRTGISVTSTGDMRSSGESVSAFAELNWKFASNFEAAGGARYTHETKSGTLLNDYTQPPLGAIFARRVAAGPIAASLSDNNVSPQLTLSWHPISDATVYVGYRTGFKAGTITNPGLVSPTLNVRNVVIRPETIKGFEMGAKFVSPDRRLSGDIDLYRDRYTDLQVSAFDSITKTVVTENAGTALIQGVEANLNFQATTQFGIHGGIGYNRARYDSFVNAACWGGQTAAQGCVGGQQDLTGQPLPRAPDWAGSVGATWDSPLTADLHLGMTADARYMDRYNFVATNNPYAIQKGYGVFDASVRLYSIARRWELVVIGKNLTDEFYFTVGSERPLGQSPGSVMGVPGLPRTVLVQATYRF